MDIKKIIFIVLLYCPAKGVSQTNLVQNSGFEDGTWVTDCFTDNCNLEEFNDNIDNWETADPYTCLICIGGICVVPTPDLIDATICPNQGFPQPTSNRFVRLNRGGGDWIEGVRIGTRKLKRAHLYLIQLRMSVSTGTISKNAKIRIHLTKWGEHWYSNPSTTGNIQMLDVINFSIPANSPHQWYTFQHQFTIDDDKDDILENLIIATHYNNDAGTDIYIDDVTLIDMGIDCCPEIKLYEATNDLPSNTHLNNFIRAGYDAGIPNISGNVIVKAGQDVTFKAGNYIELLPGFSVEAGANFTATIQDCTPITKPAGDPITDIQFNVFTPNGDGINDWLCFEVNGATHYKIELFRIGCDNDNGFFNAEGDIASNPICVWNGGDICSQSFTCTGSDPGENKTIFYRIDFDNCDQSLTDTGYFHVLCGSGKMNTTSLNQDEETVGNLGSSLNTQEVLNSPVKNQEPLNPLVTFGSTIIVTPNPTPGRTVIYFSPEQITSATARLEITDVIGKKVFEKNPFGQGVANYIDLSHLQKGVYILKISTEDEVRVEKVVIE